MLSSVRFWIGTIVSVACLWLAIRPVPLTILGQSLASADYLWLAPAVALQLLSIVARARRWVVLLRQSPKFSDSFWALGVGYLFTNVLPFRLGEPARVIVLARRSELPVVQVAATAIVERLLDVATILVALAIVLPWMHVPDFVVKTGVTFGVVVVLAFAVLLALVRFDGPNGRALNLILKYCRFLPAERLRGRWGELVSGLAPMATPPVALEAGAWSVISWGLSAGMYWCVVRAFRSDSVWVEPVFMLVSLALASSVPSSPGFIGVFQLVGQQALVLPFGPKYDAATALAITLTGHVTYYLLTTTLGLIGLVLVGGSVLEVGRLISLRSSGTSIGAADSIT